MLTNDVISSTRDGLLKAYLDTGIQKPRNYEVKTEECVCSTESVTDRRAENDNSGEQ
jgi:hypothetical protein